MHRLITRRPIYRAFPELDRFSDGRCDALVRQIKEKDSYGMWLFALAAALVGLTIVFWIAVSDSAQRALAARLGRLLRPNAADLAALAALLFVSFGSMCLVALITRDVLLSWFLRRRITNRLRRASCRRCGYLLLGQPYVEGIFIYCPECGSRWTLEALELDSFDDLMPQVRADE